MLDSKLPVKLSFTYITLYAAIAAFLPYLTPYLQQRGLSYTQIGVALALNSIIAVISQPLWGFLTDKFFNKRLTLLIIIFTCSLLIFNFVFAQNYLYILISIAVIIFFQSSIFPISDAYTYEIITAHREIQYGRIRMMGSIGFAICALATGYIIKQYGIYSSYLIYSILMILGGFLVFSIRFKPTASVRKASLEDLLLLVKDKRFSLFMLSIVIVNIAIGMHSTYIYLLVENTGGDVSMLGIVLFAVAMSELPTLFYGTKIVEKLGELNLYTLGIVLFGIRLFLNSILPTYQLVIVVQLMQSVTFAFYLLAALQYINNITVAEVKTSAMTFFFAMVGLGAFVGNIGGGILLEKITIFDLYRISSVVCISAVLIIFVLKRYEKAKVSLDLKITQ